MLGHSHIPVDLGDALVDIHQQLAILHWRREALEHLKDLDLKPRAGCHVVVVVCCVFFDIVQDEDELWHEHFVPIGSDNLNGSSEK